MIDPYQTNTMKPSAIIPAPLESLGFTKSPVQHRVKCIFLIAGTLEGPLGITRDG